MYICFASINLYMFLLLALIGLLLSKWYQLFVVNGAFSGLLFKSKKKYIGTLK